MTELFGDDENFELFTDEEKTVLGAVIAAMVDKDWWMVFDVFDTFTQNYNGQGLYWQYFYHVWRIFSASPFANAICVSSNTSTVTAVAVTPAEANVTQGANLQMTAAVTGTGMYDKQITWSATGQESTATRIEPMSGVLHVGKDETVGSKITVTATAVNGTEGTAMITVVQA